MCAAKKYESMTEQWPAALDSRTPGAGMSRGAGADGPGNGVCCMLYNCQLCMRPSPAPLVCRAAPRRAGLCARTLSAWASCRRCARVWRPRSAQAAWMRWLLSSGATRPRQPTRSRAGPSPVRARIARPKEPSHRHCSATATWLSHPLHTLLIAWYHVVGWHGSPVSVAKQEECCRNAEVGHTGLSLTKRTFWPCCVDMHGSGLG